MSGHPLNNQALITEFEACAETLGREELAAGVELIRCLIGKLPPELLPPHCCTILADCVACLAQYGPSRIEYVVLSLHAMKGEWQAQPQAA